MYLPNNPVYHRAVEQLAEAFAPVWQSMGRLVLEISEQEVVWEDQPLATGSGRGEGFAWQLYKDGLRRLTLLPGVEGEEIVRFLEVVNRSRLLSASSSDDLLTMLWEQEFVLISYAFVEPGGDGVGEFYGESRPVAASGGTGGNPRDEIAAARNDSGDGEGLPRQGLVDLSDLDSTPYFLDESEIRFVRSELEDEYRRDIRTTAIDALLDVLETINEVDIRREVVSLLEEILPTQLAAGGFGAVAHILKELRGIVARVPGLDQQLHAAILSFETRLSEPAILEQFFRLLDDGGHRGSEGDVGAILRELKPAALPVLLGQIGKTLDPAVRRTLEDGADGLAQADPSLLEAALVSGPPEAIDPAIEAVARLRLSQLVPAVVQHLRSGGEATRLAAVRTLGQIATPSAVSALEAAVMDDDRLVREAALAALMERGGSKGVVTRLEQFLFGATDRDIDRSERRTLYESYARLAGGAAFPRFRELLEPRGLLRRTSPPDIRAAAIYGLAAIGSFEARLLVDRFTGDKEPVVRSAANAVLREWL